MRRIVGCHGNGNKLRYSFKVLVLRTRKSVMSGVTLPTKHATYQIVLPIIYLYCFKGKISVRVGMDIKKASNHMNKMTI